MWGLLLSGWFDRRWKVWNHLEGVFHGMFNVACNDDAPSSMLWRAKKKGGQFFLFFSFLDLLCR